MKNIIQRDILLYSDNGEFVGKTILYQALYNSNIHESGYSIISLHRSEENAQKVVDDHKEKLYKEFLEYKKSLEDDDLEFYTKYPPVFGKHEDWTVKPIEVED